MGSRSQRRHGRSVPAGRTRSVRLPYGLLLAGAGARSVESRARLDREVRRGTEGLAEDRPRVSGLEVMSRRALLTLAILLGGVGLGAQKPVPARPQPAPAAATGGNSLFYVGTYAGTIQIFDE